MFLVILESAFTVSGEGRLGISPGWMGLLCRARRVSLARSLCYWSRRVICEMLYRRASRFRALDQWAGSASYFGARRLQSLTCFSYLPQVLGSLKIANFYFPTRNNRYPTRKQEFSLQGKTVQIGKDIEPLRSPHKEREQKPLSIWALYAKVSLSVVASRKC